MCRPYFHSIHLDIDIFFLSDLLAHFACCLRNRFDTFTLVCRFIIHPLLCNKSTRTHKLSQPLYKIVVKSAIRIGKSTHREQFIFGVYPFDACFLHLKRAFRRLNEDAITKYRTFSHSLLLIFSLFFSRTRDPNLSVSISHIFSHTLRRFHFIRTIRRLPSHTICAHINFVTSENIYTLFIRRYKICGILPCSMCSVHSCLLLCRRRPTAIFCRHFRLDREKGEKKNTHSSFDCSQLFASALAIFIFVSGDTIFHLDVSIAWFR